MKRQNKKGFTIVELVIVIAVIAILAAVLIPTFSSVIKKAKISADTQVVRNLNTSLATDEVINGTPEDFNEVMRVLQADGYVLANLNPTTNGWFYVWESETNQMLLVDENFEIKYSVKDCKAVGDTWYVAVNKANLASVVESKGANVAFIVDKSNFANIVEQFVTSGEAETLTVVEDMTLAGEKTLIGKDNANANLSMDLAGNTVTTAGEKVSVSISTSDIYTPDNKDVKKPLSQLTAQNGVLTISNGTVLNNTDSPFAISACNSAIVNIKDVVINNKPNRTGGVALRVLGKGAVMNVEDTIINASNEKSSGGEIGSGVANLKNVTINVSGGKNSSLATGCIFASRNGTVNIESGTYTSNGDVVVGFYTSQGTINISGGTFTGAADTVMFGISTYASTSVWKGDGSAPAHKIVVTGGTFNGTAFANITTADAWAVLCGFADEAAANAAGVAITLNSGTVTIIRQN